MAAKKSIQKSPQQPYSVQEFKSLFYHLNAKPDSAIKIFEESRTVSREDLIELDEKIGEKLGNNKVVGSFTSIKVALSDKRILDISTWGEFADMKWDNSAYVTHIDVQWDFNISLPRYQLPQRHTLRLRIGSDIKPAEALQILLSTDSDIEYDELRAKVVCKIDYINSVISTELLNLVGEWYESLPAESESNKVTIFLTKHDHAASHVIGLLFDIAGVLVGYAAVRGILVYKLFTPTNSIQDIAFSLGVMWITVYIFGYIGGIFSRKMSRRISKLRGYSMFNITKGDKNRRSELKSKNNGIIKRTFGEILVAVLIDVVLSVLHFLI